MQKRLPIARRGSDRFWNYLIGAEPVSFRLRTADAKRHKSFPNVPLTDCVSLSPNPSCTSHALQQLPQNLLRKSGSTHPFNLLGFWGLHGDCQNDQGRVEPAASWRQFGLRNVNGENDAMREIQEKCMGLNPRVSSLRPALAKAAERRPVGEHTSRRTSGKLVSRDFECPGLRR